MPRVAATNARAVTIGLPFDDGTRVPSVVKVAALAILAVERQDVTRRGAAHGRQRSLRGYGDASVSERRTRQAEARVVGQS